MPKLYVVLVKLHIAWLKNSRGTNDGPNESGCCDMGERSIYGSGAGMVCTGNGTQWGHGVTAMDHKGVETLNCGSFTALHGYGYK